MSEEMTQAPEQTSSTESQPQEAQEAQTPSWYFSAPKDENDTGVAGNGEVPEWFKVDKYKSVDEQAKAYNELAKRFGGFESAPENDYELPEGVDAEALDNGMLDIVKGIGKEYNMSQTMFNKLITEVNNYQAGQLEENTKMAMEKLGPDAQERISKVNDWLNVNAPKEIVEMIVPMATSAEAIQALEFFIGKTKGTKVADNNTTPQSKMTQSEYAEMLLAQDNHGNLKISTDREYKKKMDELALQFS